MNISNGNQSIHLESLVVLNTERLLYEKNNSNTKLEQSFSFGQKLLKKKKSSLKTQLSFLHERLFLKGKKRGKDGGSKQILPVSDLKQLQIVYPSVGISPKNFKLHLTILNMVFS